MKFKDLPPRYTFLEFFAGGGMARAGLGPDWDCLFANDFSEMKARTYAANWGGDHFLCNDVAEISTSSLPYRADLAWASFPCQDLSLAGKYLGLGEAGANEMTRSGTFWPFWGIMRALCNEVRGPRVIVLENVPGTLTSRDGIDFRALCDALASAEYRYGALVVDAKEFVPQSRLRLFFVAVAPDLEIPSSLTQPKPSAKWHNEALRNAQDSLQGKARKAWVWWKLPIPEERTIGLAAIIEETPTGCRWHSDAQTRQLLDMMAPLHLEKIKQAQHSNKKCVGGVYKRTRPDALGVKRQRAEVRFDDIAGCLRTPGGGSSRQTIVIVEGNSIRSRLLSPREAARLMGLADSYQLPNKYNDVKRPGFPGGGFI